VIDHFPTHNLLEVSEELFLLPVQPEEKEYIKGGYQLIKNQSQCPFRAFALHRLNAEERDFPEIDLDASQRGTLLHRILEVFWKKLKTSQALDNLVQSGALTKFIRDCVEETLSTYRSLFSQQNQFRVMEMNRLTQLVEEWIRIDLERPPFQVGLVEEDIELELAGLSLKLQVDRMDHTSDGERIIIDYKTSNSKPEGKWFDPRIQEPQLPLYNLKFPADAVTFAWVKKGTCTFVGLENRKGLLPGMKAFSMVKSEGFDTWDELQTKWKTGLTNLAQQFMDGHIEVDPFHARLSCQYCHLETLCRKNEFIQTPDEEPA
jgi:probable DNA repair protein